MIAGLWQRTPPQESTKSSKRTTPTRKQPTRRGNIGLICTTSQHEKKSGPTSDGYGRAITWMLTNNAVKPTMPSDAGFVGERTTSRTPMFSSPPHPLFFPSPLL